MAGSGRSSGITKRTSLPQTAQGPSTASTELDQDTLDRFIAPLTQSLSLLERASTNIS